MIVIVDYGVGNLGSISNMLRKIGAEATVSGDPEVISQAGKLILPGVGAFDHGMQCLKGRGLIPLLSARVLEERVPILGLCLGVQLFTRGSEEGRLPGLGWLDAEVLRFRFPEGKSRLRIPHMGWSDVEPLRPHPIFEEMGEECRFYFVHSFHLKCHDPALGLARTEHGYPFVSAVAKDNIIGVQFHPEKSHGFGISLFRNFVERM